MYKTIQLFVKMVFDEPRSGLCSLMKKLFAGMKTEDTKEVEDYFMILYKIGESVRQAPPEIQKIIKDDLR